DDFIGLPLQDLQDADCSDISEDFIEVNRLEDGAPCVTSTRDLESVGSLRLFPNPASDQVTVQYQELRGTEARLALIDLTGRVIQQVELRQSEDQLTIDLSQLSDGFYQVRIESTAGRTLQKLVVFK
ncbi:MAG: T9SS type A sorting domain-containing protein, partial [Bacteroidota bacterium]